MGAIFGFSGWSGKKSRAMADALCHRGIPPARTHASIRSTACWIPARSNHGGIIEHRGQVIALAGRLFSGQKKTHMAPLLRSYREKGIHFVQNLQGAYVLAVLDEDRIHLARDPAGLRSIYYGLHNDRFIFAVEPKGVMAWPGFARELRPAAVAQYFSYGFIPGSETMLENLWELPPGHTVTFAQGKLESPQCFFSFEGIEKEKKSNQDWGREFSSLHAQSLVDQLPSKNSVGLFLSGGLGSSAVGAEARQQFEEKAPSWSICFHDRQKELEPARRVAQHLGTKHRELLVQPKEFFKTLGETIYAAGEPLGDPSMVLMRMLSAVAAEEVEYVLNGTGSSLAFGGTQMLPVLLRHWYGGIEPESFFREQAYLASCCGVHSCLASLLTPEWQHLYNAQEALEGVLTPFFQNGRGESFFDRLSLAEIILKGGQMQLPLMERMMGGYGLTSISPLFDQRLLTLSFRVPSALKISQGIEKRIIRQAYNDSLPQEVIGRVSSKSGIDFPRHFWSCREAKKYARRMLNKREIGKAGIFHPDRVEELVQLTPEQSLPQHERTLWLLVTFELWRKMVLNEKV